MSMSRNNDYATVNWLDFAYFNENYRLTATDLSKQTKSKIPQQISFIGKFENQANGETQFFIIKNQKKLLLNFCKILQISYKNGNTKDCKFVRQFWKWIFKSCNKKW